MSRTIVDLPGRVDFAVPARTGSITGHISTDLKLGDYTAVPDPTRKRWVFSKGQLKIGQRFDLELEGADPWSLC